ncbi:hypothetical protein AMATHDRAFT_148816 [Amanita thiersii Skay4041]|uniref:Hydrophobin n=1 Tax=Amanita thiersii Skay4041 TaxID=703135 RepID=A0A2A9NMP2_9AGAR|nr:hypothetical protein AMATHDRAFT_148816 [Amanita thiersii Skay4041]
MKFAAIFTFLAATAATSYAAHETNAQRLARGMSPLPPARRATRAGSARRSEPSQTPPDEGNCNTGPVQCCNSVTTTANPVARTIAGIVGATLGLDVPVGLGCSPLSVIGVGGNSCNAQTVCCENNNFNGLIAIGCTPSA